MNPMPRLPLERQLISIFAANRENSYGTQDKRSTELKAAARIIVCHFGLQKWDNLKQKHVEYLVDHWKRTDGGRRTIEQKLSHFRWLLMKIGKPSLLPRSNQELGISPGPRHTRAGKTLSDTRWFEILQRVEHPRIRAMLGLARHFGMRFEEASLFRPHVDAGEWHVWIRRGAKGGRPRYVVIRTMDQVQALKAAQALTSGNRGLIPIEIATYEKWRQYVYRQLRSIGIGRATDSTFHDLRRTYAVIRMKHLIRDQQLTWERASTLVARELGHTRTEILDWYISDIAMEAPAAPGPSDHSTTEVAAHRLQT